MSADPSNSNSLPPKGCYKQVSKFSPVIYFGLPIDALSSQRRRGIRSFVSRRLNSASWAPGRENFVRRSCARPGAAHEVAPARARPTKLRPPGREVAPARARPTKLRPPGRGRRSCARPGAKLHPGGRTYEVAPSWAHVRSCTLVGACTPQIQNKYCEGPTSVKLYREGAADDEVAPRGCGLGGAPRRSEARQSKPKEKAILVRQTISLCIANKRFS